MPASAPPSKCWRGRPLAKVNPVQYLRDVRQEVARVTWPTRKETLITTGLVLALSALAAVFFLLADMLMHWGVGLLLGLAS